MQRIPVQVVLSGFYVRVSVDGVDRHGLDPERLASYGDEGFVSDDDLQLLSLLRFSDGEFVPIRRTRGVAVEDHGSRLAVKFLLDSEVSPDDLRVGGSLVDV